MKKQLKKRMRKYDLIIFDVSGTLCGDFRRLYDGVQNLIEEIYAADYKIALATNLSRSGLDVFVMEHALGKYLVSHISATETSFKPHPEMLELVLLETDVDKSKALMVGDTASDIYMAHNAHVDSCAVNWDGAWSPELLRANPTYQVQSLLDLKRILEI